MDIKECCVCYEETSKEDFRILKPCEHEICSKCMKEYINRKLSTCPMCRLKFNVHDHMGPSPYLNVFSLPPVSSLPSTSIFDMILNGHDPVNLNNRGLALQALHLLNVQESIDVDTNGVPLPVWREEIDMLFPERRFLRIISGSNFGL